MPTTIKQRSNIATSKDRPLKIYIHDFSGHPFQIQLSRELASRGFIVTHAYCKDIVGAKGNLKTSSLDSPSLLIVGLTIGKDINRYNFFQRLIDERHYGRVLAKHVSESNPDIVIASNTPLDSFTQLTKHCKNNAIPIIFWLQDILGLATYSVLNQKFGPLGALVGKYYIHKEKKLLNSSSHIVPISTDFVKTLTDWKIPRNSISVIENWAPLNEIPQCERTNAWSIQQNWSGRPVALYSGALGLKHNPSLLLELAIFLDNNLPEARLIVISEGHGADWLKQQNSRLNLKSLVQLPFQPFEDLPKILASANILLAILEPEAGEFCVPSKILSYMCTGRPIVYAAPEQNLASRLIIQNQAGLVVPPSDFKKFADTVSHLLKDTNLQAKMGNNARTYAERTFNIIHIGDKFEKIIRSTSRDLEWEQK